MAQLIGGFCVPHDPAITAFPHMGNKSKTGNVIDSFARVAARIGELGADTAIVVGDDHYTMFGPHCLPPYLIGIGDLEGPEEPWLNIDRYPVPNNQPLAEHIMNYGFDHGFDWAVAKTLTLDHGTMIPIHLAVTPNAGVRAIPVYTAAGVKPLLRTRRCYELGRMIGDAVAAWDRDEKVVILGTGGISHWVGEAQMGRVNEEFDAYVLDCARRGDVMGLVELSDDYVAETGGTGALEIRNWIVAMAALEGWRGELMCYEPIPEWITGLGLVEFSQAA